MLQRPHFLVMTIIVVTTCSLKWSIITVDIECKEKCTIISSNRIRIYQLTVVSASFDETRTMLVPNVWVSRIVWKYCAGLNTGSFRFLVTLTRSKLDEDRRGVPKSLTRILTYENSRFYKSYQTLAIIKSLYNTAKLNLLSKP